MFLNRFKLVLSFSAVFASVASSANLVQNGNFEASGSWTITGSAGVLTNALMSTLSGVQGQTTPFGDKVMAFNVANSFPNGVATQTVAGAAATAYSINFYIGAAAPGPTTNQKLRLRIIDVPSSNVLLDSMITPAYGTKVGAELIDIVRRDFISQSASFKIEFSDQSAFEGTQDLLIDNVSIEPRQELAPIAGNLNLGSIAASRVAGNRATLMLRSAGNVVELQRITLGAGGVFFGGTQLRGSFEVAFKAPTWLSKSAGIKSIGDLGLFGINANLQNGDCDDNNVTNTDDYLILSDAFDTSLGDSLYDARADLNQDGIVNTDDYLILNDNFDLVGD